MTRRATVGGGISGSNTTIIGATSNVIWKPGSVSSPPNSFATWAEIQNVIAKNPNITVFVDSSLQADTAAHIPAASGTTDCKGLTRFDIATPDSAIQIDNGAQLLNPKGFHGLSVYSGTTGVAAIQWSIPHLVVDFTEGAVLTSQDILGNNATAAMCLLAAQASLLDYIFDVQNVSPNYFFPGNAAVPMFSIGANVLLSLSVTHLIFQSLPPPAALNKNGLFSGPASSQIQITVDDTSQQVFSFPAFSGSVTVAQSERTIQTSGIINPPTASGTRSIAGGDGAVASGPDSVAFGTNASATQSLSACLAPNVKTDYLGEHVDGVGSFKEKGSQVVLDGYVAIGSTSGTLMLIDRATEWIPADNSAYIVVVEAIAKTEDLTLGRGFSQRYMVRKSAGTITVVAASSNEGFGDAGTASWALAVAASGTTLRFTFSIPGALTQLVLCSARVRFVQIAKWTPANLPGLLAWYDASSLSLSDGASVSAWNDSSGAGDSNRNFTQTGTNRPTYKASDANYNNKPTVQFVTANSQNMRTGAWSTPPSTSGSVIIVGNATANGTQQGYVDGLSTSARYLVYKVTDTEIDGFLNATGPQAVGTTPGSKHLIQVDWNGASSKIYIDAVTAVGTGNPGTSSPTGLTMGSWADPAQYLNGTIAEIIVTSANLSTTNRTLLMDYLGNKYGITIGA